MSPKLKDVDSADQANRIRAFTWSFIAALIGAGLGVWVAQVTNGPVLRYAVMFGGGLFVFAFFGTLFITERLGNMGGSLYFGSTSIAKAEYSLADSYIARDMHDAAVAELERAAAEHPDDPEPCFRLARLLRDRLRRHEEAIRWLHDGARRPGCTAAARLGALREAVEIRTHALNEPRRALSDLARIAHDPAAGPLADWARDEMDEIRRNDVREDG